MSTTIATLKAILTMDTSEFTSGARKAQGDTESMGSNLLGGAKKFLAFGAAAAAAAVPTAMFLKGAIDSASDLNETVSKNQTIFGKASDELLAWADNAPKALGMTKNAALDATGTLGNLFTQLGISADAARKMSQANVQLATDFASFHNANPEDVIDAMTAAYRGEYDAVQRFVPTLNAAHVEEKALLMTKKASKDALTDQDKALAVNALMMEGAGAAAGDFARTSDSAANRARIAAASFEEMKTKLGNALLPAWNALLGFITGSFFPAMERLGSLIASVVKPAFDIASDAVRLFIGTFTGEGADVQSNLGGWMNTIIELGAGARRVFDGLADAWQLLTTGTTSDELTTRMGEWGPKVQEVRDIIVNFASQVPGWLNQVSDAWSRLTDVVGPFWETIKGNENLLITIGVLIGVGLVSAFIALAGAAWSAAAGVIAATWPFIAIVAVIFAVVAALRYAYENWDWFRTAVDTVVQWLTTNVPPAFEAIRAAIAVAVEWITGVAVPWLTSAWASFSGFLNDTFLPAVRTVWTVIVAVVSWVADMVINIVGRITSFISDNWNWIAGLAAAIWDQIRSVIANAWQIISNIIQLFLNIISGNWEGAWNNIKNIVSAVVDLVIGTVLNLGRVIGNVFMLIVSFAGNMLGGVVGKLMELIGWFDGLRGRIMSAVGDLGGLLLNAGKDILRGLLNGIESMVGAVKDKLNFVTKLIPSWKGPMTVDQRLLEPSGTAIMGGLMRGIARGIPALRSQLGDVTGIIAGTGGTAVSALRGSALGQGAGGGGLTVVVNGRARAEDGVAVVNSIAAWERVAGTTWRNGREALTAASW